ncbi:hypothetical protein IAU60_001380 [Kwoniella sp. DSM 27419]
MDNDHDGKNEHLSSPKGPEDASGIADEYPSPEREPQSLHDHLVPDQPEGQHDERSHPQHQIQHHRHEDTDMQTELANQVAAQAIEAAVAAEVRANASAASDPSGSRGGSALPDTSDAQASGSLNASQHPGDGNDHMQATAHIRAQHHPRQPTFPRTRPQPTSLGYPLSGSAPPNGLPHRLLSQPPVSNLSSTEQIAILREAYAKNPNPSKRELEALAIRTGRPWNKIREYFRQRRNKLRGLDDLENMVEPGRASGWLQVAYRAAPPTAHISQLSLYNSYRHRFDPYISTTPLMGGQELIQLACATFPGCEMARDEGEYVLRGLKEKEKEREGGDGPQDEEEWEKGMEGLVEPLRAGSWLLSSFQHQSDPNGPSTLTQTDLYTSYAARFSSLLTNAGGQSHDQDQNGQGTQTVPAGQEASEADVRAAQDQAAELKAFEDAGLGGTAGESEGDHQIGEDGSEEPGPGGMNVDEDTLPNLSLLPEAPTSPSGNMLSQLGSPAPPPPKKENRLLNPLELINLARMTFPKCEPIVDASGRFVIRGLERREGAEPGARVREREMFPFALMSESRPGEAFVGLMKRKLGLLQPEPEVDHGSDGKDQGREGKRARLAGGGAHVHDGSQGHLELGGLGSADAELTDEDRELIDGLRRFRGSKLGEQVREACVTQ